MSLVTISSIGATQQKALDVLKSLAGKDLINLQTGIKAQINRNQRTKIISNKAIDKTKVNGFTANQHYAVAESLEKAWQIALITGNNPDNKGDKNISSIKRFEAQISVDNEPAIAYITVKETIEYGHRIYSLELQEIKKAYRKYNALKAHYTDRQ